jgi:pantoate--beta-alanine ligase
MQIFKNKHGIRDFIRKCKTLEKRVGFVPTMGYLHQGHLSLMQKAAKDCEIVVASIFVNPTQFGPQEDFSKYPRDLAKDCQLLEAQGVDALFYPDEQEMYGRDFSTWIEVSNLSDSLCGRSRPGHFKGVATVVTKLFNIIQPDSAYFGQKDAQQSLVIKQMVRDLDLPVEVVIVPTVREKDGLAMSSRNVYLNPEQRAVAPILFSLLKKAGQMVAEGEREIKKLESMVISELEKHKEAEIDYVEIRSLPSLEKRDFLESSSLMALAVRFGQTRLIDNIILEV